MSDRAELIRLFRSIQENAEIAVSVLADADKQGQSVDNEAVFRAAAIDTRLGQVRVQIESGHPDSARPAGGHLRGLDVPDGAPAA